MTEGLFLYKVFDYVLSVNFLNLFKKLLVYRQLTKIYLYLNFLLKKQYIYI